MPLPAAGTVRLEVCVDTPDGLATAIGAGADRIELCSSLGLGGLTPSPGLMALASASPVPVYAMIRPRPGDFVYSAADLAAMRGDIAAARAAGLAGVVLGASSHDRTLDLQVLAELCAEAADLGRTLHRAFDLVPDREEALEQAVQLGFARILTSGGALDAPAGIEALASLVHRARGRISIMAGGGVRPKNVADLVQRTGVDEVHASARMPLVTDPDLLRRGFVAERSFATSRDCILALRAALR